VGRLERRNLPMPATAPRNSARSLRAWPSSAAGQAAVLPVNISASSFGSSIEGTVKYSRSALLSAEVRRPIPFDVGPKLARTIKLEFGKPKFGFRGFDHSNSTCLTRVNCYRSFAAEPDANLLWPASRPDANARS
jgi:hypothetical protein